MEIDYPEVYVLWNDHKLRAIYENATDALDDLTAMKERGYKECYVSGVQLQTQTREAQPIDEATREGLQRMVERI